MKCEEHRINLSQTMIEAKDVWGFSII